MAESGSIGIVVIGRNEGDRLKACLQSIPSAIGPVIYVDSGSTDGSSEAARGLGAAVVQLDLALPFTAARARNDGYKLLRSLAPDVCFVQFVDGDCALSPDWLGAALAFLRARPDVAVVCGRRRERHPEDTFYNRLIDGEWDTPIGEAPACGGDALMRTAAFDAVDGFDAALMAGEEPELCSRLRRAGWKIWRLDSEMTVHDAQIHRFGQWWLRAVRSGYGYAQVWAATRRRPGTLYRRELLRAVFWGGIVPLSIFVGCLIHPVAAAAGVVLYALQILRIAFQRGFMQPLSWAYAATVTVGKFAELRGAIKFAAAAARNRSESTIDYKKPL